MMYFRHNIMRQGQDALIKDISFSLENKLIGLFEAPTGLGKTDAALSGVLEFAKENKKKIFFITPKNTQHKIVIEAVRDINKKYDADFKIVDLVAKNNLCIDPFLYGLGPEFYELCEKKIHKQMCLPYLNAIGKGPLKNIVITKFLAEYKQVLHSNEFREECQKHDICPYVASILVAKNADIVVCDVNYIFVSKIRQNLFNAMGIELEDCVFIFDEAHNLPSRLRTILSESLSVKQINYARKEFERCPKENLYDITDFLETLEYLFEKQKEGLVDENYFDKFFKETEIIDSLITAGNFIIENDKKKPYLFKIASFMVSWLNDKKVKTRYKKQDIISIKGLDPSFLSNIVFDQLY